MFLFYESGCKAKVINCRYLRSLIHSLNSGQSSHSEDACYNQLFSRLKYQPLFSGLMDRDKEKFDAQQEINAVDQCGINQLRF